MDQASLKTVWRWRVVLAAITLLAGCERESTRAESEQAVAQAVSSPDGIPISYEVHGAGTPALVFIHGWSCDRSYWAGQLDPFSRDYQVVAVDLAGHGESGLGRAAWTMEAFGGASQPSWKSLASNASSSSATPWGAT